MTTTTINTGIQFLNHAECVEAILAAGAAGVTTLVVGEAGTGKTSMQKTLSKLLPKHVPIYADMAVMDVGDIIMRMPFRRDDGTVVLEPAVSSLFKMDDPRPKLIMLDEIGKMPRILQPTVTRLMQEHTVGDEPLPDGSIVWCTTNNVTDGLGDVIPAHTGNRIMILHYAKPDSEQTNAHFTDVGVSALTRAWIAMNPRAFHSYMTHDLKDNPFPFSPTRRGQFVSQRSMFKADNAVVKNLSTLRDSVAESMLSGLVGAAASQSMMAFFRMASDIQPVKKVFKDPQGTPVPDKDAALYLMNFNAIDAMETQDDLTAYMDYLDRKGSDVFTALFFTMVLSAARTKKLARSNPRVCAWAKVAGNYQMLM